MIAFYALYLLGGESVELVCLLDIRLVQVLCIIMAESAREELLALLAPLLARPLIVCTPLSHHLIWLSILCDHLGYLLLFLFTLLLDLCFSLFFYFLNYFFLSIFALISIFPVIILSIIYCLLVLSYIHLLSQSLILSLAILLLIITITFFIMTFIFVRLVFALVIHVRWLLEGGEVEASCYVVTHYMIIYSYF